MPVLPFRPEPSSSLAARLDAALAARPWADADLAVTDGIGCGPAAERRHVFDSVDGLRLLIFRRTVGSAEGGSVLVVAGHFIPAVTEASVDGLPFSVRTRTLMIGLSAELHFATIFDGVAYFFDKRLALPGECQVRCWATR